MSTTSRCMYDLRASGVPYPRTCEECGLGPCKRYRFPNGIQTPIEPPSPTPSPSSKSPAAATATTAAGTREGKTVAQLSIEELIDDLSKMAQASRAVGNIAIGNKIERTAGRLLREIGEAFNRPAPAPDGEWAKRVKEVAAYIASDSKRFCENSIYMTPEWIEEILLRELHAPNPGEDDARDKDGVALIAAERTRQVQKEGWSAAHDDEHDEGQIAQAAACYALGNNRHWPWNFEWWKPKDRLSNLVRAGALIAAEIDRLKRAAIQQEGKQP